MDKSPFSFGPISKAVFGAIAFIWFCTEVGMFIEVRTGLGQERLFWPLWVALCTVILLGSLLADNSRKSP